MVVRIGSKPIYLWRTVDDKGEILDMPIQRRRDNTAALRLMRKLLKRLGLASAVIVTDRLRSYASAFRDLHHGSPHEQGLRANKWGGELASGRPTTRAEDAVRQVARIRAAFPQSSCRRLQYLQHPPPPHLRVGATSLPRRRDEATANRNARRMSDDIPRLHHHRLDSRDNAQLAEGAGFEPAIGFPLYTLSKRAPSTARPPLPPRRGSALTPSLEGARA